MNAKEFFYCVANMRDLQRQYFKSHDKMLFMACRAAENEVDREIRRVKSIVNDDDGAPGMSD